MWPRFGIKVGNSTLCIAYVKADGKADVIANKQGDRVSQACLLWGGAEEIECGLTAKQKMATRPKQAVANSFQLLLPADELTEEKIATAKREIPCEYNAGTHTFQLVCSMPSNREDENVEATRSLSPFEVMVKLLGAELELARQYHSEPSEKPIVVLSVPSYYPESAWSLLSDAAEEAGFHVAQVIAEPSAAVLGYGIGETQAQSDKATEATDKAAANTTSHVLTIKGGGLFSHFAVYSVCPNGFYTQLDTYGPFPIGGRQYTDALVQFICEEFQRKNKLDPHESRRSLAKIRTAAANCKHILTTLPSTQLYIDSLMDGVDFNVQMSRARFESLIQPAIAQFMQTLGECVDATMKKHPDIKGFDSIVLLGATMQIPKLQSAIAARFPSAQLHTMPSADEVVAIGCARQALFLFDAKEKVLGKTEEFVMVEQDFLIWHGDDESEAQVLVGKGSQLPNIVRVDLKLKECQNGQGDVLHLKTGDVVTVATLAGLADALAEGQDTLEIEANISWDKECSGGSSSNNGDNAGNGGGEQEVTPVIRLRCI